MKVYKKAIVPCGFKANGIAAGIKESGKLDLGLLLSEKACKAAAVFTTNKFAAAPVKICRQLLKKNNPFYGVVVNSGNANCFTGNPGLKTAWAMSNIVSKIIGFKPKTIFVASTGIIGRPLRINNIIKAMPKLIKGLCGRGIKNFSGAIQTTDKFKKELTVKLNINDKEITICAVCKGAGMIFPNMATMLCFIATDLNIDKDSLQEALEIAVADSFNSISVDGCQSTNDMVLILANGQAGNKVLNKKSKYYFKFLNALKFVCLELAKMIVKDGEGSTKIIQIKVEGAMTKGEAKKVGFIIANSNLFKTAMYGRDPNFGRIVQAVGTSGIEVEEKKLKIRFSPLGEKEVRIWVSLGRGTESATVYASDLTPEYIRVNARYN